MLVNKVIFWSISALLIQTKQQMHLFKSQNKQQCWDKNFN